jgi:GT2 family glycosyltransferase
MIIGSRVGLYPSMTAEHTKPPEEHAVSARLGVVLVAYQSNDVLPGCLDSLTTALQFAGLTEPGAATVVIVNNDLGRELELPGEPIWQQVVIQSDGNVGFSPAVNSALASVAEADYVLLLNPDARLAPNSLALMIDTARKHQAALVGPLLTDKDGHPHGPSERPFHSIRREMGRQLLGTGHYSRHYGRRASRDGIARCLTGACLLVEREFLDSVGGLDTTIQMYLEDVMLCWQAHVAQRPVILALSAHCQHVIGGSTGGINDQTSIALYLMILWARLEFVRRRTGPFGVYTMRLLFVLGATLRCVLGDGNYRRRQQIVIWWRSGPYIELPPFLGTGMGQSRPGR